MLLAIQINAQEDVDGYTHFGRGSCQDSRGKMYSYLQRIMTFPNAETCGRQECERFGNLESYRGFEFSVAKRCTCLFDADEMPAVPEDSEDPTYVSKTDSAMGSVVAVSGTPGTNCYQFGVSNERILFHQLFYQIICDACLENSTLDLIKTTDLGFL